ncbi:21053_t:CDS:2, partial [Cetraspora pellucida]
LLAMENNITLDLTHTNSDVDTFNEEQKKLNQKQQSNNRSDNDIYEKIKCKIQNSATFSSWKSLENALRKYKLEVGFKLIKY